MYNQPMKAEGSMVSKSNTFLGVVALIVLTVMLGFIGWGIFHMWQAFWEYISHADSTIGAGIIAAAATIIVSVLSIVLGRIFERSKELELGRWQIEQEIRKENLPRYQKLVDFLFKVLDASRTGTQIPQDEMNKFFISFTQEILVWGSDRFIKDFSAFRESGVSQPDPAQGGTAPTNDPTKVTLALEKLLYSIRSDCGHKNKGLGVGDLLTLFIIDIRNYIKK
jgi:hypothetical protein